MEKNKAECYDMLLSHLNNAAFELKIAYQYAEVEHEKYTTLPINHIVKLRSIIDDVVELRLNAYERYVKYLKETMNDGD